MTHTILIFEPLLEPIQARLKEKFEVLRASDSSDSEIAAREKDIRAVVTGGGTGLPPGWFDRLPNLGLVAVNGVGTDKVDLDRAAAAGIHVSTTPDVLTDDVADLGMALVLCCLRTLGQGERLVRSGAWGEGQGLPLARSARGKRLGIVGLGGIGRAIGQRAEAFGMEIGFWNRSEKHVQGWTRHADPEALAQWADILAVAIAATSETQALIDRDIIRALGPDGYLVNIARGAVVDEPALLDALETGAIAGAGLDVFLNEPRIDPRFLALDNVFLFPHQGSATIETRTAMAQLVLDNVEAFFDGKTPPTSVTAGRFAS